MIEIQFGWRYLGSSLLKEKNSEGKRRTVVGFFSPGKLVLELGIHGYVDLTDFNHDIK